MQPTLASLQLESLNPKWSQQQQNSFKWLAVLLEEKYEIHHFASASVTSAILPGSFLVGYPHPCASK